MKNTSPALKIGLVQMFCEKGAIVKNLKETEHHILEAEKRGIDILGFPEANLLGRYAQKYKLWIAVATQAGRTIDEDFPGGGYVFSPDGKRVFNTLNWSPQAVYLELDLTRNSLVVIP